MMVKILVLLSLKIITLNHIESCNLTDGAAQVAHAIFKTNAVTAVTWTIHDIEFVGDFLSKYKGLVVTTPMTSEKQDTPNMKKRLNYKQLVVFSADINHFENYMKLIYNLIINPIQVLFIATDDLNVSEITRTAWIYDIGDIVILKTVNQNVTMTSYFPYRNGSCNNTTPVMLKSLDEVKLAFTKKFVNFNRCPIRLSLLDRQPVFKLFPKNNGTDYDFGGPDGLFFAVAKEKLNASVEIVSKIIGREVGEELIDLLKRRSDALVPPYLYDIKRYRLVQLSNLYRTVDIHWLAPKLREISQWGTILKPLQNNITPLLGVSFVIFVIVIQIIKKIKLSNVKSQLNIILNSYLIFLGQDSRFETPSSLINSLFVLWIWCCTVVRLVYQSNLTNGLQTQPRVIRFTEFADAQMYVPQYGGPPILRQYLLNARLERDFRKVASSDVAAYIRNISVGQLFLLAGDVQTLNATRMGINIVKKPFVHLGTCIYLRPGWPAGREFNSVIRRVFETGFMVRAFRTKYTNMKNPTDSGYAVAEPLNLDSVLPLFYVLLIMTCICIGVFIIEIVIHRLNTLRPNSRM